MTSLSPDFNLETSRIVWQLALRVMLQPRAMVFTGSRSRTRSANASIELFSRRKISAGRCLIRCEVIASRLPALARASRTLLLILLARSASRLVADSSSRRANVAMPSHACSVDSMKSRTSSITAVAHAVGVLCDKCATSSATLTSISCPMPVKTGSRHSAIAVAI